MKYAQHRMDLYMLMLTGLLGPHIHSLQVVTGMEIAGMDLDTHLHSLQVVTGMEIAGMDLDTHRNGLAILCRLEPSHVWNWHP